jgi:hypothetical protein
MAFMALFLASLVGKCLLAARKRRNDPAIYRDKADPRIYVTLAVFAACMLAWVLWAIWIATTRGVPT